MPKNRTRSIQKIQLVKKRGKKRKKIPHKFRFLEKLEKM